MTCTGTIEASLCVSSFDGTPSESGGGGSGGGYGGGGGGLPDEHLEHH
jgi:hypothetical protein